MESERKLTKPGDDVSRVPPPAAAAAPIAATSALIMRLQRTAGNHAVARMLAPGTATRSTLARSLFITGQGWVEKSPDTTPPIPLDRIVDSFKPADQAAARQILTRLVAASRKYEFADERQVVDYVMKALRTEQLPLPEKRTYTGLPPGQAPNVNVEDKPFPSSNEFDLLLQDPKKTHVMGSDAPVVVGAGTNAAWDEAVRARARQLVLLDWEKLPLLGQEYLLRPLILAARDRREFVSFLSGVPYTDRVAMLPSGPTSNTKVKADEMTIPQTMQYAQANRPYESGEAKRKGRGGPTNVEIDAHHKLILERVKAADLGVAPDVREAILAFVGDYLKELRQRDPAKDLGPSVKTGYNNPHVFGPFAGLDMGKEGDIWNNFFSRYMPAASNRLIDTTDPAKAQGAAASSMTGGPVKQVDKKELEAKKKQGETWKANLAANQQEASGPDSTFSVMASEHAFQHLQMLMREVEYAHVSLFEPQLYADVAQRHAPKGGSMLVVGSNIVDVMTQPRPPQTVDAKVVQEREKLLSDFLVSVVAKLHAAQVPVELLFKQTAGAQMPHGTHVLAPVPTQPDACFKAVKALYES